MRRITFASLLVSLVAITLPATAAANLERLCDPGAEDCRQILINHIRAEKVGLDVAFWFMEDSWIASEIINRHKAGVPVRVLVDPRANVSTPRNADRLAELKAAGVPMRQKVSSGILHWKMMLFAGQGIVEFSGANFSSDAWLYYGDPYTNYVDEAIYFTSDASVVNSFRTKYDDLWVDTTRYANYANIDRPLWRAYDKYPKDPELNFPPFESFADRSVDHYNAESQQLDVIIYRITDQRHTNAVIAAAQRGVPVRLITEPQQYRDPNRLWHSWNIDRLYMAGVQIRNRAHAGLNHQKLTLYHSQNMSVLGSSNWTSPSDNSQEEHNYFTTKPDLFAWLSDHFERKWTNGAGVAETAPFAPLPPDPAVAPSPANGTADVATTNVTIKWNGGFWAHNYDIYFGTSPNPPLLAANRMLGPSQSETDYRQYTLPVSLQPGTTYYWKIVSKTMADLAATSQVWSFTTAGGGTTPPPSGTVSAPWTSQDIGAVGVAGAAALSGSTFTVQGSGADIWGTADALHFLSQPITGDLDVIARVASVDYVDQWTKAGVMIRGAATAGSAQALMLVSPGKGLAFQRRTANGAASTHTAGGTGTAPAWVKLERRGNTIKAYRSANGTSWTLVGSDTFAMPSTVLVGLAVSSHDNTRLAAATFDGVAITSAAPPAGDTQAPTVQITSPASGATVSGTVNVAASASDNVAVARVEILLDGTVVATDASAPYQFAWDTTSGPNAGYTLRARAVDTSGNATTSSAVQVTVNNTVSATPEIVLWTADATRTAGAWRLVADATAAGGLRMNHPDAGAGKIATAAASPTDYFELTFNAVAGVPYRLWMRGKADGDYWANDSVFVQFSGSVMANGSATWRIGTTSAAEYNLEECSGCRVSAWGWQDNGWGSGVLGPLVYFAKSGTQTIRIQTREDGLSIDQVVLSPSTYLQTAPGPNKNDATILGKMQ